MIDVIREVRLNPQENMLPTAIKNLYLVRNHRGDYQVALNTEIKGTYSDLQHAENRFNEILNSYIKPKRNV